ncbi:MAG TPA: serine hydrolase [Verrucomicrobiales bacterium]|nr:serine hydrolase [Verrucomicrobiae bacterium]MCP5554799.1 serine hydrolase [Akkermansiaceae bacterium]HRX54651.1 serine hydrolase [Verrucomicrobiales bacterium]
MKWPVLSLLLILPLAPLAAEVPYFPPPDSAGGWREARTEKEIRDLAGMDLVKLEPAFEITQRSTPNGGLLVLRHGHLCFERYFGRASRMANPDMASTGKAFCSVACGIMLEEYKAKIPQGLDTKVFNQTWLPEALPLDDPRKAEITLGQLLCMTAGCWGEGQTPSGYVKGQKPQPLKPVPGQNIRDLDNSSLGIPLWCDPGAGYSYSSPSPHIASIVLRHVTGMELKEYINERLAKPQGWGEWDYCLHRGDFVMPHANGAGSTALHATDVLRFGYCLAHGGKWGDQQLVPADYIRRCQTWSPYNPHTPFSLQWEHNADGHVAGAPRDAFWKSGAGGFCLYVVPSLDLVIYKLGGKDGQYDPSLTLIPQPPQNHERDNWQPIPATAFHEGTLGGQALWRVLEMTCAAVRVD